MAEEARRGETNTSLMVAGVIIIVVVIIGFMWFSMAKDDTAVMVDDEEATGVPAASLAATPTPTPAAASATATPLAGSAAASPVAGAVKSFTVAAANFKFTPAEIRVKQGDTVKVTLTNDSTMPHDWRADDFSAATKTIAKGQTDTVQFVASKKGTFEYYCSVGNHRQMGMVGKLIVE